MVEIQEVLVVQKSVSSSYEIVLEALKSQIGSPYAYGAAGELVTRASIDSLRNISELCSTRKIWCIRAVCR